MESESEPETITITIIKGVFESACSNRVCFGKAYSVFFSTHIYIKGYSNIVYVFVVVIHFVFGLKNCVTISTNSLLLNMVNVHLYYAFLFVLLVTELSVFHIT